MSTDTLVTLPLSQLEDLKSQILRFEQRLQILLEASRDELEIAAGLQRVLMPDRLPQITGVECFARYLSAQQLSAESFDIIPTLKGREAWLIASWTERFGLGSVLLQALMHLQSKALIESRSDLTPADVFNDLSVALTQAKRAGRYRLFVARLDTHTLRFSGVSVGCGPLLRRAQNKNVFGEWEMVQAEELRQTPALLESASSDAPVTADRAHNFSFTLAPGSRLFYLSAAWAEAQNLEGFARPLGLDAAEDGDILEDLNHLLIRAEDHLRAQGRECDITGIALRVDQGKLHLA